jgi:hypothetical protein
MSWVRIDDDIVDNPKTLKVWAKSPEAFALDVRAIAYSAKHLTDGLVPDEILALWYAGKEAELHNLTEILVGAGRWERVGGGFEIHDFLDYNKSREEVEIERAKRAKSGAKGGKASGASRRRQVGEEARESLGEANE